MRGLFANLRCQFREMNAPIAIQPSVRFGWKADTSPFGFSSAPKRHKPSVF